MAVAIENETLRAKFARKHNIEHWDAEDVEAWESGNKDIAKRNLIWSVIAEHVGFSVWSIWSVMVLFMPTDVYGIDAAGKFFLVAVPTWSVRFCAFPTPSRRRVSAAATGRSSVRWCCSCRLWRRST